MRAQLQSLLVAALVIGLGQADARGGLIFNNTTSPTGSKSFTSLQIGNEVNVSGPDLMVNSLEIGVNQQGVVGTADLQAFLYANDGTGGAPGTLLWSSSLMTNVALTGGDDLIAFAVPDVTVPTTFTWAIQISNTSPVAVGLPNYDPPTVGSVVTAWFGAPGNWTRFDNAENEFMARISTRDASAVPGPSSLLLASLGIGACLAGPLRRKLSTATR